MMKRTVEQSEKINFDWRKEAQKKLDKVLKQKRDSLSLNQDGETPRTFSLKSKYIFIY